VKAIIVSLIVACCPRELSTKRPRCAVTAKRPCRIMESAIFDTVIIPPVCTSGDTSDDHPELAILIVAASNISGGSGGPVTEVGAVVTLLASTPFVVLRNLHSYTAALNLDIIHGGDRLFRRSRVIKSDKTKAFGPIRFTVRDNLGH